MTDKILGILALIGLFLFLLPLIVMVPHKDLILFVCACVVLAGFDYWETHFHKKA